MPDTDEDEFFDWARREMFPKIADSKLVVTLLSSEPDPKLCLELGASLLFDKPIILVALSGFPVPPRLAALAASVVEIDEDESLTEGPGRDRFNAALDAALGGTR